jgi:hypothetical protein
MAVRVAQELVTVEELMTLKNDRLDVESDDV